MKSSVFGLLTGQNRQICRILACVCDVALPSKTRSTLPEGDREQTREIESFIPASGLGMESQINWLGLLMGELNSIVSDSFGLTADFSTRCNSWDVQWESARRLVHALREWFERTPPPHMLLVENDVTPANVACVLAARELGIPSAMLQHGALVTKVLHQMLSADFAFVYGPTTRKWYMEGGIRPDRIRVTGSPRFDEHFGFRSGTSREDVRRRLGLPGDLPLVTLCSTWRGGITWRGVSLNMKSIYGTVLNDLASVSKRRAFVLAVRPHPTDGVGLDWWMEQVEKRGLRIASLIGSGGFGVTAYGPLLWASDLVIGFQSTVLLESHFYGTPTLSLNIFRVPDEWERLAVWEHDWGGEGLGAVLEEALRTSADSREACAPRIAELVRHWHPQAEGHASGRVFEAITALAGRAGERRAASA